MPAPETVNDPDIGSFRPPKQGLLTQNAQQTPPYPPVGRRRADQADSPPQAAPVGPTPPGTRWLGGATGTSGMPLTASGRERPPDSDACRQVPRSHVSGQDSRSGFGEF